MVFAINLEGKKCLYEINKTNGISYYKAAKIRTYTKFVQHFIKFSKNSH